MGSGVEKGEERRVEGVGVSDERGKEEARNGKRRKARRRSWVTQRGK
jgi:hypothetical protein